MAGGVFERGKCGYSAHGASSWGDRLPKFPKLHAWGGSGARVSEGLLRGYLGTTSAGMLAIS